PGERDAERADSYGTGELIAAAIDSGAKRVLIAAGGSASTDGGRAAIDAIEDRGGLRGATLEVLCDVDSCFEEAADNFAPQKGADEASTARLGARLSRFAAELPRDPRGIPMGGCAGGLSGGLMAAYDAELRPGAEFILDMVSFDARLAAGAAAITGEGRLDEQSGRGKIVGEIAKRCAAADAELFIVVGHDASRGDTYPAQVAAAILEASTLTEIEAAGATIGARIRT
ncbi:MAG TPA: glycerate kinase, partial [Solirubrobacterales bacterium]